MDLIERINRHEERHNALKDEIVINPDGGIPLAMHIVRNLLNTPIGYRGFLVSRPHLAPKFESRCRTKLDLLDAYYTLLDDPSILIAGQTFRELETTRTRGAFPEIPHGDETDPAALPKGFDGPGYYVREVYKRIKGTPLDLGNE